jgi:hypothetical protein
LFCKTIPEPDMPVTVPPIKTVPLEQVTATLVMGAEAVPVALVTVQFCCGLAGCLETATEYEPDTLVTKIKDPLPEMGRSSPLLSWSTKPPPTRPLTEPPMENGPTPLPVDPELLAPPGTPLQAARINDKTDNPAKNTLRVNVMAVLLLIVRLAPVPRACALGAFGA